ncbi:MAG: amino acid ABC transporter substrate-binding protein [Alphaproteobacteria bacterium]|nr:amino acid ABC transporter substrate-binding protein [Alphaproteobacteria bacterium]
MMGLQTGRRFALLVAAAGVGLTAAAMTTAQAGERMDSILASKTMSLGYRTDAPPFSVEQDGRAAGFTVELCVEIGNQMAGILKIEDFSARLVKVDTTDRFDAIARGDVDLLCGATTANLARRNMVSFSIPTFSTGVGAVVSTDASDLLKEVLIINGAAAFSAAATAEALKGKRVGVRTGTTAAEWLSSSNIGEMTGIAIAAIQDHGDGIQKVADGELDAYFADAAILLGNVRQSEARDRLLISRKTFTNEPYAIALPRGDDDLRLAVDTALSRLYRSGKIYEILTYYFGKPTPEMALFYNAVALPE